MCTENSTKCCPFWLVLLASVALVLNYVGGKVPSVLGVLPERFSTEKPSCFNPC